MTRDPDRARSSGDPNRRDSWQREDVAEESAVEGTRTDLGQSGETSERSRERPGFEHSRGAAGSLSDAAAETAVSQDTPGRPRTEERPR